MTDLLAACLILHRTDLAELLGSAIALNLIFPSLPLWGGVLITSADVLLVLVFFQGNQNTRRSMMAFELIIVALVLAVFACFAVLVIKVDPDWGEAFFGYVPSKRVFGPGLVVHLFQSIESLPDHHRRYLALSTPLSGSSARQSCLSKHNHISSLHAQADQKSICSGAQFRIIGFRHQHMLINFISCPAALFIGSRLATVDRLGLLPAPPPPPPRSGSRKKWHLPSRDIWGLFPKSWNRPEQHEHHRSCDFNESTKGKTYAMQDVKPDQIRIAAEEVTTSTSRREDCEITAAPIQPVTQNEDHSSRKSDERPPNRVMKERDDDPEDDSRDFNRLDFIRQHINHATCDIVFSLIGFAVTINSA